MKVKKFLLLSIIFVFSVNFSLFAQESEQEKTEYGWQTEVVGTLNLTQASFDNWEQGGENNLAWQVTLNTNFTLDREKYNWVNKGKFSYGLAKVGDAEAKKSDDEIKLETIYIRKLGVHINPFVSATALTQFAAGFDFDDDTKTKVSGFLDPGYFTQSAGISFAPRDEIKTRLGATLKETITNDFPVPYADDPKTSAIEEIKVEGGITSVTEFKKKFEENILFTSELELFSNLQSFDQIDVNWENDFSVKVAKYINVSLNVELFYDRDISKRRQFKQVLALGLTYSFFQEEDN